MWSPIFEERLQQWHDMRTVAQNAPEPDRYLAINNWWFTAPMIDRHLQWDDFPNWPGPWKLLADNRWCSLARALGTVYTLMMIDQSYQHRLTLYHNDSDNLVGVDNGKYILNWCPGEVLNTRSKHLASQHLTCDPLYSLIE